MGVVVKQSIKNIVITYFGFALGAINTLFLFTQFLSKEEYGVFTYVIAMSNLLWPIIACGFHNTIIKYFKKFQLQGMHQQFFTWMLIIPTLGFVVLSTILWFNQSFFESYYQNNAVLKRAVFPIFLVAVSFGYFELFYAWAKVHLRSVEGNFLKQLFNRIGICVLLFLVYKKVITEVEFLYLFIVVSFVRTLLMKIIAFRIEMPSFSLKKIPSSKEIVAYTLVILVVSMVSVFLLELDKVMLERFLPVTEVAVYTIIIYIATVIEVPMKSMMQITTPLTSSYLEEKKFAELSDLNKSTSIITLVIAGLIALLVFCNAPSIYAFIPENYKLHLQVLFIICLVKLVESGMGITNAILYNSDHYKWLLLFGIIVATTAVLLNLWLIPVFGLTGAALSTLSAYVIYDIIKVYWVYKCYGITPFTGGFYKITGIIIGLGALFIWVSNFFGPSLLNLVIKSILIVLLYIPLVIVGRVSDQINNFLIKKWETFKKR